MENPLVMYISLRIPWVYPLQVLQALQVLQVMQVMQVMQVRQNRFLPRLPHQRSHQPDLIISILIS